MSKESTNRIIGKRLKAAREEAMLSQEKAAELMSNRYQCPMNDRTIRRYEAGENSVSIENLLCFADLYNKTLDNLVYGHNTTNDDSLRWEDMLKRLNRLIYSGILIPQRINNEQDPLNGKYMFLALDDTTNVYLENTYALCTTKNYQNKKGNPDFNNLLKDFDSQINKVVEKDEKVYLSIERIVDFFHKNKEDPTNFIVEKIDIALKNKQNAENEKGRK